MGTVPLPLDGVWKTAGTDLAVLVDITHRTTSPFGSSEHLFGHMGQSCRNVGLGSVDSSHVHRPGSVGKSGSQEQGGHSCGKGARTR